jgi:hypothetical protein
MAEARLVRASALNGRRHGGRAEAPAVDVANSYETRSVPFMPPASWPFTGQ